LKDIGVFVLLCSGVTLTEALGELARVFPGSVIAYFHLEMMFSPSDLLDRLSAHHESSQNDFSYVADIPERLAPEMADASLLSSIGGIPYNHRVPSPREAVLKLVGLRATADRSSPIRAEPLLAKAIYAVPDFECLSSLCLRDDAERAREALMSLPEEYRFEAVERWPQTTFNPLRSGIAVRPVNSSNRQVLYVSPGSAYSGAEECLRGLVDGLGQYGYEQTAVIGLEGVLAQRLRAAGCQVISANWNFTAGSTAGAAQDECSSMPAASRDANRRFATEIIATVRPDYVHCNNNPGPSFIRAAQDQESPIIAHVRIAEFDGLEAFHSASTHLIAVSEFVKHCLIEGGRPPDKITMIYEGVDAGTFSPGVFRKKEMRQRFGLQEHAFVVCMIARITPQKRHDVMLDAFADLCRRVASAQLVLVGSYEDKPFLRTILQKVSDLALGDRVTWLSFQEDIRQIECASDVVVLPSDREPLGLCILEAMSLQLPVVVSDSGGSHELIEEGISGLTMRAGDATSLTAQLLAIAGSEKLRSDLGHGARKRVERLFTLEEHVKKVDGLFRSLSRRD
jgi:glycosyltransferase involved in cell wall biosynthesis